MATNIPPHNAGELCDAALHLIKFPNATADKLVDFVPGPDLPDRRHHRRAARRDRAGLQDRARQLPFARALDQGRYRPRHLSDRRHRDSRIRSPRRGWSPASPSCCCRRSCRCSPMCATSWPKTCGSCSSRRAAASIPILLMESLFKLTELETRVPAQHECAEPRPGAERAGPAPGLARMARPPPGGAGPPLEIPPRQDRPPPRGARRLSHRLSQYRQGHQNHPREG